MSNPSNARNRAQSHFKSSEQRRDAVRAEIEKERVAVDVKTARLKALRLAREAEQQIDAERLAAEKSEGKTRAASEKSAEKATAEGD